jgi:DnaJ-class molecular chaperone
VVAKPLAGPRRLQRSACPALGAGAKKDAVDTVSKAQARRRKCGFCNGAGHFYPIDEGPLQECQICNGSGLVRVKVLRKHPKGRGSPRDAKVDPGAGFGRVRAPPNG